MFSSRNAADLEKVRAISLRFMQLADKLVQEEGCDPVAVINGLASQLASALRAALLNGGLTEKQVMTFVDALVESVMTGDPVRK